MSIEPVPRSRWAFAFAGVALYLGLYFGVGLRPAPQARSLTTVLDAQIPFWPGASRLRSCLDPTPTTLVYQGRILQHRLESEGVSPDDVAAAAREHGLAGLQKVEMGVLEMDGILSIIASDRTRPKRLRHVESVRNRSSSSKYIAVPRGDPEWMRAMVCCTPSS